MATPTTYYSGIDLHKKTTFITTLNAEGEMIAQQKLRNHPEVLRRYFRQHQGAHRAVVESTTGWYWLAGLLSEEDVDLRLGHAKHLKAISYAKVKTDKVPRRSRNSCAPISSPRPP